MLAVHVANVSNPAGNGDSGVTKNCGAIGNEAGAPLDNGKDEPICPQPDRLKGTCCFQLVWVMAGCWSDIAALTPKKFHTGSGRDHNSGFVRGTEDGEGGSSPRLAVRQDTRAGCVQHYKVMQNTSTQRKAHESYDCSRGASSGFLECHGAFHKTGCAAEIVESHNLDPRVILRMAGHDDPFDLPQGTVRYLGNCNTVLTQVSSLVALV
ncbi:hypothetical protein TcYC6_0071570 [Trypanosoma cruzi]|nr:hypothetical protein TcYC6_0071570 [Trypanosoma cruzi]